MSSASPSLCVNMGLSLGIASRSFVKVVKMVHVGHNNRIHRYKLFTDTGKATKGLGALLYGEGMGGVEPLFAKNGSTRKVFVAKGDNDCRPSNLLKLHCFTP